jgi:hypothetical protein
MAEYVWITPLGEEEVSPRCSTAQEAGEWLRGSEGQRVMRASLFPLKLRAINDGNWTRDATGAEKVEAGVF